MFRNYQNTQSAASFAPALPQRRKDIPKQYPCLDLKTVTDTIANKCGDIVVKERHGEGKNKVIILPEAFRELEVMISYGRRSPMNVNEQKYVGYGHTIIDEKGSVIIVVSHFIEILTKNRNPVGASNLGPNGEPNPGLDFLEYHREEFLRGEVKYNTDAYGCTVDPFLKFCGSSEYVLEGHTHPDIGVFFSGPDRISGAARAAKDPVCIFVCDPIRKQMLGNIGKTFASAEVIVYTRRGCVCEDQKKKVKPPLQKPLVNELVSLAEQCIRIKGCKGNVDVRSRRHGKAKLKIKMLI